MHDISTHIYTATVEGVDLHVTGGSITLNASQAPHVQGSLQVLATEAAMAVLVPSGSKRVAIFVVAEFASYSQSRTFDLTLREAIAQDESGIVTLTLASDESLLMDYAPLADDYTPFLYQASLRAVVDYVLDETLGAGLAAEPDDDADVSVYSDSVNMIPDPSVQGDGAIFVGVGATLNVDDTSWWASGDRCVNLHAPVLPDSYLYIDNDAGAMALGMQRGKTYVFSATGRIEQTVGGYEGPHSRRITIGWRNGTGAYQEAVSDALPLTVGVATRLTVTATLPLETTEAFVRAYHGHGSGIVQWDAFRLSEASLDPTDDAADYFDGDTGDTSTYAYAWSGDQDQSTSVRTALITRAPDSLLWRAGINALEFLSPVLQAAGYRLVCDESRVWTLRSNDYTPGGTTSIRYGVNLLDGSSVTASDGDWFDARVTRYTWTDSDGNNHEAVDAFALTDPYQRLTLLEIDAPYPGPGRSEYAVRRAQGRARQLTAKAIADWRVLAEGGVSIVPQYGPSQTGVISSVTFNLDDDTMDLTTRTRETPEGAIDNLTGTINSLTGTINDL